MFSPLIGRRSLCAMLALGAAPVMAQTTDSKFAAWLQGVRADALRAGVDSGTADAALGSIEQLPKVLELARNQPEFKMTFDQYLDVVVSAERVAKGRTMLKENRALVDRFAAPVGIPSSVVMALWGIESKYGAHLGDFEVAPALATLAFNGFRASFFRSQLIATLKILSQRHVPLHEMKGSWAGAMGQCQFIPTTFLAYAADGDGDGRFDIWKSKADVFASTVNYLHRAGWRPGLGWGEEADSSTAPRKGERLVKPGGAGGPVYRTTENFRVILRWNQSDFFALAVGLLSDRIAA
ncbi:membrane-bound lytic murein transglycosylase B [Enhydrobacter aerosaccus]|uniref:Membrane-bound lytic murein transglycosylase B n=1 Tax=Enhydrobacter aerosaccus TaxID=225324 RepID=A0A1T4L2I3_9HYPH|nr:lytic murein transglycosylase [Enhydrobacter aerosaccus]SJZ48916.1 membrane-bound lytic murein transglycosylase B [Enhydrobacter aerosaccus]